MDIKTLLIKIEEDKLFPLMLRLNIEKTKEEILDDFSSVEKYKKIIVSQEESTRKHFHILVLSNESDSKNARQNLRNFIKRLYGVEGNESYSIPDNIRKGTHSTMAAYVVKDQNYVSKGFTENELEVFRKLSYKKYNSKEFVDELNIINASFMLDKDKDEKWWLEKYVKLKVSYNQVLNVNTVLNQLQLICAKKYGVSHFCDQVLERYYAPTDRVDLKRAFDY